MTWEEFKKYVESKDVNDHDEIRYIDITYPSIENLRVDKNEEDGLIEIW